MEKTKVEEIKLDLFHPKKAELQEIAKKYEGLTINGLEDKEGLKKVHNARVELKGLRVQVKNTRLEYTRQFDQAKREAMGLEKELIGIIEPVERELEEQENAIKEEKERIKREKEEAQRKILQERVEKLALYDFVYGDLYQLSQMEEKEFGELLSDKREAFEKIQEEKKAEERRNLINSNINDLMRAEDLLELENMKKAIEKTFGSFEEFQETFENKKELLEMREEKKKLERDKKRIEYIDKLNLITDFESFNKLIYEIKQFNLEEDLKDYIFSRKVVLEKEQESTKELEQERIQKEADKKAKEELERKTKNTEKYIEMMKKMTLEQLDSTPLPSENDYFLEKIEKAGKEFHGILKARKEKEEQEQKKKEEQAKLEKKKKYKDFLKKNGVTQENIESGEYTISKNEDLKTITIFKKIDVFSY